MTYPKSSSEILISLATGPVLLLVLGTQALTTFFKEMGEASEEVFRGDRLPLLNVSNSTAGTPDSSSS